MDTKDIQIIRKQNLKLIIDQFANGNVDIFSTEIGKHRTYVYAMLKSMEENNPRAITSKMARFIENHYNLPALELDNPEYKNNLFKHANTGCTISKILFKLENDKFIQEEQKDIYINLSPAIASTNINNPIHIYEVEDYLMEPRIACNSHVFVELQHTANIDQIENGAIYIIGYNKKVQLARIYLSPDEMYKLRIDNPIKQPSFPELNLSTNKFHELVCIFGKVIGQITFNKDFK